MAINPVTRGPTGMLGGATPTMAAGQQFGGLIPLEDQVAWLRQRVQELETRLFALDTQAVRQKADGVLEFPVLGKIEIAAFGSKIKLDTDGVSISVSTGIKLSSSGATLSLTSHEAKFDTNSLKLSGSSLQADFAMAKFSGTLQCSTLIAGSVVSSSYTPGAGNVW